MWKRVFLLSAVILIGISLSTGHVASAQAGDGYHDLMGVWCAGKIVFSSNRGGNFGLYVVGDKAMSVLIDTPDDDTHPICTPDARRIVWERTNADKVNSLWIADISGKNMRQLVPNIKPSKSSKMVWNVRGELVVSLYDAKNIRNIYAIAPVSGKIRQLTTDEDMDKEDPVFAWDGSLCFAGRVVGEESWKAYCLENGKQVLRYDLITHTVMMSVCAKDGRWAFSEQIGDRLSILAIETSLGGLRHVTELEGLYVVFPEWSADCSKILVSAADPNIGVFRLYVYQLATGQAMRIDRQTSGGVKSTQTPAPTATSEPKSTMF